MYEFSGIKVANLGLAGAVGAIVSSIHQGGKHLVVTFNPEMAVLAYLRQPYQQVLAHASLVLPDGFGIWAASYLTSSPLTLGRVQGRVLVHELVKASCDRAFRIVLLGASKAILDKATLKLRSVYSNSTIVGSVVCPQIIAETGAAYSEDENNQAIHHINDIGADVLMVGFGHPKQELWINKYKGELNFKVAIGVGGTFDYLAGVQAVPPSLLSQLGLEWFWRLIHEPRRLPRIFVAVLVFPAVFLADEIRKVFHVEQK